jgi:kynurenine formamidase
MEAPADTKDAGVLDRDSLHGSSAAKALGIEQLAQRCVQTRGVMLDLKAHFGTGRTLIGYDEVMQALAADHMEVTQGDILCLHTGFAERILEMQKMPDHDVLAQYGAVLNGRDTRLLQWISDSGIAAIAADNYAVEAFPAADGGVCCAALPLHEHCLFKLGLHLGELWRLTPLADHLRARGRYRFLLTAPPLNLPGAIASPLTPIGTL